VALLFCSVVKTDAKRNRKDNTGTDVDKRIGHGKEKVAMTSYGAWLSKK